MKKKMLKLVVFCIALTIATSCRAAQPKQDTNVQSACGVLRRILPKAESHFILETIPSEDGKDVFEIDCEGDKIVLRGSNGVSICSALNWYLKYYCNCHISWCGNQLNLPSPLPKPEKTVRRVTAFQYRYDFNYCTFGYTMAFWDWDRWEQEIDWMALNGINLPLALTGAECAVRNTYLKMGFTQADIDAHISGPSFMPWFWMGNLDAWGGPLPEQWYTRQESLQKKILDRQRSLGMKPVLKAFTGHVPAATKDKYPDAKITKMGSWGSFPGTYLLDPADPLFKEIGRRYLQEMIALYGTDHIYAADTFNEMKLPTTEPEFFTNVSRTVYASMAEVDPEAVWVMQGWMFLDSKRWPLPLVEALLDGVADDRMIILDLFSTAKPQWQRTRAYMGKPWIWNMLHNWGGKQGMYGRMHKVARIPEIKKNKDSQNMVGIGTTQEGSEVNPIVFDHLFEMTWRKDPVDLKQWTRQYAHRRYGRKNENAEKAWDILLDELYTCNDLRHGPQGSYLVMRPTLSSRGGSFSRASIFYDTSRVQTAFLMLLNAAEQLGDQETYRHDLADLARQVMSDYSQKLHKQIREAVKAENLDEFKRLSARYLQAIEDTDRVLASQEIFLLGRWLGYAREAGQTASEKERYEFNARNIITLWGTSKGKLHGYAQRQYGGMMGDFNCRQWKMFFDMIEQALQQGKPFKHGDFEARIRVMEEEWCRQTNPYPSVPQGDTIELARKIADEYLEVK